MEPDPIFIVHDGYSYYVTEDEDVAVKYVEIENAKGFTRLSIERGVKLQVTDKIPRTWARYDGSSIAYSSDALPRSQVLEKPFLVDGWWKVEGGIFGAGPDLATALRWLAVGMKDE